MIEKLYPRVDFGGFPWPTPVSGFTLDWLKSTFAPAQRKRADQVAAAISSANTRIEAVRAEAVETKKGMTIGTMLPNGSTVRTAEEQRIMRDLGTLADRQVVDKITKIKRSLDGTVPPVIKEMERASMTSKVLMERVFDRYSCLWRASAGMKQDAATVLRANYAAILERAEGRELGNIAQRAIDDGSAPALILVDALLRENLRRSREHRGFHNAELLQLVTIPEADEAAPLLQEVVDLHRTALESWAVFANLTGRLATYRIRDGLKKLATEAQ